MIATPNVARANWNCPIARIHPSAAVLSGCKGDHCVLWRFVPLDMNDARFKRAIKSAMNDLKKPHKAAVAHVMENREALGLPMGPEVGYCGLGGKVEA